MQNFIIRAKVLFIKRAYPLFIASQIFNRYPLYNIGFNIFYGYGPSLKFVFNDPMSNYYTPALNNYNSMLLILL